MTKLQQWTNVQAGVQELLASSKVPKKFSTELLELLELQLAPKNSGSIAHPPKDIDGTMHYYCRFHQAYEPIEKMVMSQEKSKGYCKASISLWNKTNAKIKKLDVEVVKLMAKKEFEDASVIAEESELLRATFNKPEFYDIERDWEVFTK